MKCLVTGAAGFIGSHLCTRLLREGYEVLAVDSFTDYYSHELKEKNLAGLRAHKGFQFISQDLNTLDLNSLLQETPNIFHLAAQAGVRASWGDSFAIYTHNNISATQKLLEAARSNNINKFVYASSSSVYGACPELPMTETSPLRPFSPYGVSKLAAENLCSLYYMNYAVPTVSLRFFTVYGPRQRPDMAFHKFLKAVKYDQPITLFGDGKQTRDFTYIDDIIDANILALKQGKAGEIYNTGGGNQKVLSEIFPILEEVCARKINIERIPSQKGDVPHTLASIKKAEQELDFKPKVQLSEGLKEEWKWIQKTYSN